jgi:hypothetical protein
MDSKLLVSPGRLCAILALIGSFWRRRSTAWVDCMLSPLGWITVMDALLVAADVLVDGITSDLEAVVSIKAVVDKLGGLEQPGSCGNKLANTLQATSTFDKSAGANRQVGGVGQPWLSVLLPFVSVWVAVVLCPRLRRVHEVLKWPTFTLYPWVQQ